MRVIFSINRTVRNTITFTTLATLNLHTCTGDDLSDHSFTLNHPQMAQQKTLPPSPQSSTPLFSPFLPIDGIMATNWWSHWECRWHEGWAGTQTLHHPVTLINQAPSQPRTLPPDSLTCCQGGCNVTQSDSSSNPVCHPPVCALRHANIGDHYRGSS